ncbi:MAG: CsoR family transcriptional regulator [Anaerocolumna sp.]|jgi:DNA-binding FrmR family transcriptional regulator|nr:CsoR family transcriptional regulator [Anaerocolumna sp.]
MKKSIKLHAYKTMEGTENTHNHSNVHIIAHSGVHTHDHINTLEQSNQHGHVGHRQATQSKFAHSHGEGHSHSHKNTKVVLDRLSRASGHLESVKRMVLEGKDCSEVLIQLSAVIAALNNTGKVILKDHIENCIVEAVESGDKEALDNLNSAIDRFIK